MNDLNKIKQLRQSTGAGFKDCGAALEEAAGNIEKASEILRVKGISKASKKMSREAKEGVIALSGNESSTSIIELNCETDFVAKNNDFIKFAQELSEINYKCKSDIELIKRTKMKNNQTVDENLIAIIAKIGEKITLGRSKTLKNDSNLNFSYLHSVIKDNLSKLGVVVSLSSKENSDKVKTFGKQLAMHVAASNPLAINLEDIDKEIIQKEELLINEELKNSGKPEEIIKKISIGKLNKFKEENSLLNQAWVIDPKKKSERCHQRIKYK